MEKVKATMIGKRADQEEEKGPIPPFSSASNHTLFNAISLQKKRNESMLRSSVLSTPTIAGTKRQLKLMTKK